MRQSLKFKDKLIIVLGIIIVISLGAGAVYYSLEKTPASCKNGTCSVHWAKVIKEDNPFYDNK